MDHYLVTNYKQVPGGFCVYSLYCTYSRRALGERASSGRSDTLIRIKVLSVTE